MSNPELYVGLMSGTSVDGLDVALCRFTPKFELIAAQGFEIPPSLRDRILNFCDDRPKPLDELMRLDSDIARIHADCVNQFLLDRSLSADDIHALGFHGQTLRHLPENQTSLQCGNAAMLAELTKIDVIADFRRRDLAAGGQGAPLVPAFHAYLAAQQQHNNCAFLNLGGIANLTLITPERVLGFDTGPANVLLDHWIQKNRGRTYDAEGAWARSGGLDQGLLTALLNDTYFDAPPPKSTGREKFNAQWLQQHLEQLPSPLSAESVQRTLLELTARSVTEQLLRFCTPLPETLYVCGGGAYNTFLLERIQALLPGTTKLKTTAELNLDPNWVEAAAFAWLAEQFFKRQPGNLSAVTGASGPRILGAHYPR